MIRMMNRISTKSKMAKMGRNFTTVERERFEGLLATLKHQDIKTLIDSIDKWWKTYDEEMDDSERSDAQDAFVDAVFPSDFFGNKDLEKFATETLHYHSIHPLAIKKVLEGLTVTAALDRLASELERIDPRLALAIDQVSDKLEARTAAASINKALNNPLVKALGITEKDIPKSVEELNALLTNVQADSNKSKKLLKILMGLVVVGSLSMDALLAHITFYNKGDDKRTYTQIIEKDYVPEWKKLIKETVRQKRMHDGKHSDNVWDSPSSMYDDPKKNPIKA